jgi:hypothetical protein
MNPLIALAVAAAAVAGPAAASADPLPFDNICVDVTAPPEPLSFCLPWGSPLPDLGCVVNSGQVELCTD